MNVFLFKSYIKPGRSGPLRPRFTLKSRKLWPSSSNKDVQGLQDYFQYDTTNINEGAFTMVKKVVRPTVFDPIEIVLAGTKSEEEYLYEVSVSKLGKRIYSKVFKSGLPWDVLEIRNDFSGEEELFNSLRNTTYPFTVKIKNDYWSFEDSLGTGFARVFGSNLRSYWTNNKRLLFESRLVHLWFDFNTSEQANPKSFSGNLQYLMRSYTDGLIEAKLNYRKENSIQNVLPRLPDFDFMKEFFKEIVEIHERIFKERLDKEIVRMEDNDPQNEILAQLKEFKQLFENCIKIDGILAQEMYDLFELVALVPEREALKAIQGSFVEMFAALFKSDEHIFEISSRNANINSRVKTRVQEIQEALPEAKQNGLVWRSNLFFFGMIKRSLLNRILSQELPMFKNLSSIAKRDSSSQFETYLWITRNGFNIILKESEIEYWPVNEPESKKTLELPAKYLSNNFKVISNLILFNIKNRGLNNWGCNLHLVNLEKLKEGKNLSFQQLKAYDLCLSFSASPEIISLAYVKGLIPYFCTLRKGADGLFKENYISRTRKLFQSSIPLNDADPQMEKVVWKNLTMVTGVCGTVVIIMMTNYPSEESGTQRLYAYRSTADDLVLLCSTAKDFKRSYFKGRRVDPKHLSIFTRKKTPFAMISSDYLNYHLSVFLDKKFHTVMSWDQPKRLLLSWRVFGGIESIASSWDSLRETFILYGQKSNKEGATVGTVIMRLGITF